MIENLWKDQQLAKKEAWPQKLAVKMVTLLQQQKYGHGHSSEEALNIKEALWKRVGSFVGEEMKNLPYFRYITSSPPSTVNWATSQTSLC